MMKKIIHMISGTLNNLIEERGMGMNKKLYDLLDWAQMEGIIYSDEDHPGDILGAHIVKGGILVQAYFPTAQAVSLICDGNSKKYAMLPVDEEDGVYAGFYAVLIPGKTLFSYHYEVKYAEGVVVSMRDPYVFEPTIDAVDQKRFNSGIHKEIYEKLGAHVTTINGVTGVDFAVWAPNAVRVSVVGAFNDWDGRRHPMNRLGESGIFELFIPDIVEEGEYYKFEIRQKNNEILLKSDPYGTMMEYCPNHASIVCNLSDYQWNDDSWMKNRGEHSGKDQPVFIYEVHLGSFHKPEDKEYYSYRELAGMVAEHVKKMNYTHVELMPVMEYPSDESLGYEVMGYYAATSRYGKPQDLKYFIDCMHKEGIGVILDWTPAYFSNVKYGLRNFDGTCLYEHLDPRKGVHPENGMMLFNYGRPEVKNYLIANALFWMKEFHVDGLRLNDVASMLYLDYGRTEGQWIPNMYGGNENLEAIDFIRELNEICHKENEGILMIAEETSAWPMTTGDVTADGLGFDYKWNNGWSKDFLDYMRCDPLFRKGRHNELTLSMLYQYSENYILAFTHNDVMAEQGSMVSKMPGNMDDKMANLRLAYGYMVMHPGKKHLFMGQDFAQYAEWDANRSLDWKLNEDYKKHQEMMHYVAALAEFYKTQPALYQCDYETEGFEWISSLDADHSILVFVRRSKNPKDTLFIILNFTPVVYTDYLIGVPCEGKYKEIFNSDAEAYGGNGYVNSRLKQSKKETWENREDSIRITVPPLGVAVFSVTALEQKEEPAKKTETTKRTTTAAKKPAAKKTAKKAEEEASESAEAAIETTATKKRATKKADAKVTTEAAEKEKSKTGKRVSAKKK